MSVLDMIVAMRGGIPECCDFCGQPFNEQRQPIPEEAGEWTCTECLERWEKESAHGIMSVSAGKEKNE